MTELFKSKGFRQLFDAAADALLMVDRSGRIVVANPAAEALFGYTQAEFSGLTVEDLIPPRFRTRHHEHRARYHRHPQSRAMGSGLELQGLAKNHAEFPVDISLTLLEDGMVLATVHDITRRKQLELALRASEQRFRTLVDHAPVMIWMSGRDKGCTFFNRPWLEFTGRTLEQEQGEGWAQGVHPDDLDRCLAVYGRHFDRRHPFSMEYRLRRRDGEYRWILDQGAPYLDGDGGFQGFIGSCVDITERKHAEQMLREQHIEHERLLKLHVASQTVAAIAHELNQPLNAVATYNEAALRLFGAGNPKPDKLARALEGSVRQAQRAARVMRDLLDFLHRGESVTEPLDLNKLVREAVAGVEANGDTGGFVTVLDLTPHLPPVQANRIQIEKVLVNLLRNGVEAMEAEGMRAGTLTVTVRTAAVSKKMAQVTVQDSGPGLDTKALKRIFQPFFTTKPQGIGLGLAINRALIEAHGGELWAEPSTSGACFHFTLPFAQ